MVVVDILRYLDGVKELSLVEATCKLTQLSLKMATLIVVARDRGSTCASSIPNTTVIHLPRNCIEKGLQIAAIMLVKSNVFPRETTASDMDTIVLRHGPRHVLVLLPKTYQVRTTLWINFRFFDHQ